MKRLALIASAVVAVACFASSARADVPPDVFAGAGVFVDSPANFPGPWALADELQAAHFTWIALHVEDFEMLYLTEPLWIQVMRDHGLHVGVWGMEWPDPVVSAVMADMAIRAFGFDFYIADAEGPYEKKGAWRSSQFVQEFRALQPTIPAALVTLGAAKAPYVLPIDFASWRDAGFSLLPEAYYNQYKGYRPDLTVDHAIRAGWPVSLVHPVIGVYHHYPASKYVPLLQTDGASGFSVFLADQATAADFAALSQIAAATLPSG
jgi:hypothetical protein